MCIEGENPIILLRSVTWDRESHSLFDYETKQVTKRTFKIENSWWFVRDNQSVSKVEFHSNQKWSSEKLISFSKDSEGNYFVESLCSSPKGQAWLVIRAIRHNTVKIPYELHKNDIVKLGRIEFRVVDMHSNGAADLYYDAEKINWMLYDKEFLNEGDSLADIKWKFWLDEEIIADRPLINCWNWKGGIKYVHLDCLKQWQLSQMRSNSSLKSSDCVKTYTWKKFECELWKKKYPYSLKIDDERYERLVDYDPEEQKPFIYLESMPIDSKSTRVTVKIIPTNDDMIFSIGRNHDSDIRVSDISVSRKHCSILFKNGKFLLEDWGSKFGTLIKLNSRLQVVKDYSWAIQIGRTVLNYVMKSGEDFKKYTKSCTKEDAENLAMKEAKLDAMENCIKTQMRRSDVQFLPFHRFNQISERMNSITRAIQSMRDIVAIQNLGIIRLADAHPDQEIHHIVISPDMNNINILHNSDNVLSQEIEDIDEKSNNQDSH